MNLDAAVKNAREVLAKPITEPDNNNPLQAIVNLCSESSTLIAALSALVEAVERDRSAEDAYERGWHSAMDAVGAPERVRANMLNPYESRVGVTK